MAVRPSLLPPLSKRNFESQRMTNRIDQLRNLVANIGKEQTRNHRFFPHYADQIEVALGAYLGDSSCVALANAGGGWDFDAGSYRHEGLGFDANGLYRLPIMVRLKNFNDEGSTDLRLVFHARLEDARVHLQSGDRVSNASGFDPADMDGPCAFIFECLKSLFDERSWFDKRADYQGSGIGFVGSTPRK